MVKKPVDAIIGAIIHHKKKDDTMHTTKISLLSLFMLLIASQARGLNPHEVPSKDIEYVTVAILAKDKSQTLPLYLACIENQTWPANKTYLYIRTNNNNDDTAAVLLAWAEKVHERYAGIYFDDSDVEIQVQKYGQHEWNYDRFLVLGKIRQDSVNWAWEHNSHYFVADCDNFIKPHTIEAMINTNLSIVAPILRTGHNLYSNYHAAIDAHGYFENNDLYMQLIEHTVRGLVQVPVVHCTYLVRYEVLDKITYDDGSARYEYVIFSDSARKQGIPQYLDNREVYGRITFAENIDWLRSEPWLHEFADYLTQIETEPAGQAHLNLLK